MWWVKSRTQLFFSTFLISQFSDNTDSSYASHTCPTDWIISSTSLGRQMRKRESFCLVEEMNSVEKRYTTKHELEPPPTIISLFLQKTVGKQKSVTRATSIIGCISHPGAAFSPNNPDLVGVPFLTTDHEGILSKVSLIRVDCFG